MSDDAAFVAEVLRVYQRYALEVVEGWGLCPWASSARREGKVAVRVALQAEPEVAPLLALLDELALDAHTEVAIVILPRLGVSRREHERFAAAVRDADVARTADRRPPFAIAAFHHDAEADLGDGERLVPYLRRTPDPTLQLVRVSVLDSVRQGTPQGTSFMDLATLDLQALALRGDEPTLRERIARHNLTTVERRGVDELDRTLRDIRADRDRSYARFAAEGAR